MVPAALEIEPDGISRQRDVLSSGADAWAPPHYFSGDSFAAGHGVADVEERFANRIRNQGEDEVHVWADLGYDTGHHLELVQGLIAQGYEFDVVVLAYNLNDIGDLSSPWKAMCEEIGSAPLRPLLSGTVSFWTHGIIRLKGRFNPDISNYCQSMLQCYNGQLWIEQQQRLDKLRQLVEAHGGHLLVVTFPFSSTWGRATNFARSMPDWTDSGRTCACRIWTCFRSTRSIVGRS